jgi:hypothetical protein
VVFKTWQKFRALHAVWRFELSWICKGIKGRSLRGSNRVREGERAAVWSHLGENGRFGTGDHCGREEKI